MSVAKPIEGEVSCGGKKECLGRGKRRSLVGSDNAKEGLLDNVIDLDPRWKAALQPRADQGLVW